MSSRPSPFPTQPSRALELLAELDRNNRASGADLRTEAYRIAEGKRQLQLWLERSDDLAETLLGSRRLRLRRRFGILRWTEGSLLGLPYFEPLVYPTSYAPDYRVKPLLDELDFIIIAGRIEAGQWRPVKDELNFDEARAIAMMKAGTLYRLTSKGVVPGLIRRSLDSSGRSHTTELRFSTVEYMRWAVVQRARFR